MQREQPHALEPYAFQHRHRSAGGVAQDLHLDVKPRNIIMAGSPRLIDLSVARAVDDAVIAAASPHLSGAAWAKTRRLLSRPESFTFLDQAACRLADLGLEPARRGAGGDPLPITSSPAVAVRCMRRRCPS